MNKIEFVLVLLFTFFVIVVWVTSEIVLVKPSQPDDPKIQAMLEPLQSSFDQETLNLIVSQKPATYVPPVATATATPNPTPTTATPSASPRGRATPTPAPTRTPAPTTATQSATPSAATNPLIGGQQL
jgi:uncharacterized membrane protein